MRAELCGDKPDYAAVANQLVLLIRDMRAKKVNARLEPGVAVKPDGKPKEVSAKDKTILEMKRDIDLLRMELSREGRGPIRSPDEVAALVERYLDMGMHPKLIESRPRQRGAPAFWNSSTNSEA